MKASKKQGARLVLLGTCLALVICCTVLGGCESSKIAYSGFLGDYSGFRVSPEHKGALEYTHPTLTLKNYDKFMIDPVIVHFAPNAKGTALDPSKIKKLTDYAREELSKAISKHYQVADGHGSARQAAAP